MEQKRFGQWFIECDPEATWKFYQNLPRITEHCDCLYCRNYTEAYKGFPSEVLIIFKALGIDPAKAAEVYECNENENGTHFYGGWFHFVGKVLEGANCPRNEGEGPPDYVEIAGFRFGFTNSLDLIPRDFPQPAAQLEFDGNIPWVLDEKPGP